MLKRALRQTGIWIQKSLQTFWRWIRHVAVSWPKAFAAVIVVMVLSYYPLGGFLTENIDKTPDYNLTTESEQQSLTVETIVFLINREVNDNLWTANLPMFFPSYFLDNMPNFQQGIIGALSVAATVIDRQVQCPEDSREKQALAAAVSLLKYPGNIWLFSPDNSLKIVPSSSAQYKKARKRLRDFNRLMPAGQCVWKKDDVNLRHLIAAVRTDLTKSAAALEEQVVEHGSDWVDNRADDLFYYNQGKMYAYMLVLKALSTDFKQILLDSGQYQTWTEAIRALEDGTALSPFMVRNGNPGSVFAANHLIALGYYMLSGANILGQINLQTEGVSSNED